MRLPALVLASGLALSACGGLSAEDEAYREDLVDALMPDVQMPEDEEDTMRCIAEASIDTYGVDRLREAGVTPYNLSPEVDAMIEMTPKERIEANSRFAQMLEDCV